MAKRKKQKQLPGFETKSIKELDDAAESYVEARDKRMKMTEKEVDAKEALIGVMKKHKLDVYRDENASPALVVTLLPGKDKVKVADAEEDAGEEDDGDEAAAN